MAKLDQRWSNIYASTLPYIPLWEGPEHDEKEHTEFLIEVLAKGQVLYQRTVVANKCLEADGELYGVVLDKMVKSLDKRLGEL